MPGDYDRSGIVDNADRVAWAKSFNATTNIIADGNADTLISAADFVISRDFSGVSSAPAAAAQPVTSELAEAEATSIEPLLIPISIDTAAVAPESVVIQETQPTVRPNDLALELAIAAVEDPSEPSEELMLDDVEQEPAAEEEAFASLEHEGIELTW